MSDGGAGCLFSRGCCAATREGSWKAEGFSEGKKHPWALQAEQSRAHSPCAAGSSWPCTATCCCLLPKITSVAGVYNDAFCFVFMILLPSCAELSAVAPLKQSCVLCWGWQCWVVAEQRSCAPCTHCCFPKSLRVGLML